jgi:hypothetical protein
MGNVKEDGVQRKNTPPSMAADKFVAFFNLHTSCGCGDADSTPYRTHRHRSRQDDRHAVPIRMSLALIGLNPGAHFYLVCAHI